MGGFVTPRESIENLVGVAGLETDDLCVPNCLGMLMSLPFDLVYAEYPTVKVLPGALCSGRYRFRVPAKARFHKAWPFLLLWARSALTLTAYLRIPVREYLNAGIYTFHGGGRRWRCAGSRSRTCTPAGRGFQVHCVCPFVLPANQHFLHTFDITR